MNLLPYVLCRRNEWEFSDESISEVLLQNLNEHSELLNDLCREIFPTSHDLEEVYGLEEIPVGLIHLAPQLFYKMVDNFKDSNLSHNEGDTFVRGVELINPEKVLMFPDDNSERLYLSAFIPMRVGADELLFHSKSILIIPENTIPYKEIYKYENGCTLMAKRTYPDRIFRCKNTMCEGHCAGSKGIERSRVTTIKCECC